MERPTLEYAENCTLIHTYARKLEEYCDELEKKIERLEKALDKACTRLESFDSVAKLEKENWKEWCMKDV